MGRRVRRPDLTLAVADHNTPTTDISEGIVEEESRIQVETLESNVKVPGVPYIGLTDTREVLSILLDQNRAYFAWDDHCLWR